MKRILSLVFSLIIIVALSGCAGKDATFEQQQQARADFIQNLKDAKFKGRAWMKNGGSPLSVGSKNVFFLGPENMESGFEGDVDFSGK